MAGSFRWSVRCRRDGLAQDLAQLHQPLAGLGPAALAGRRQGEHLGEASLMGDQIAASSSSRAWIKAGRVIRSRAASVPSP